MKTRVVVGRRNRVEGGGSESVDEVTSVLGSLVVAIFKRKVLLNQMSLGASFLNTYFLFYTFLEFMHLYSVIGWRLMTILFENSSRN